MSFNDDQVRKFEAKLKEAMAQREAYHTEVFRESLRTVYGALVGPSSYGPGVPVDTGTLRANFGIGVGSLESATLGSADIERVTLEDAVFLVNTMAYAVPVEEGRTRYGDVMRRRTAEQQLKRLPGTGEVTTFVDPVVRRWPQIVEDVILRLPPPPPIKP